MQRHRSTVNELERPQSRLCFAASAAVLFPAKMLAEGGPITLRHSIMSKEREHQPHELTLDQVIQQARDIILEHGEHPPLLIMTGSKQNVLGPISNIASTHEGRVQQLFQMGFELGLTRSVGELKQIFFISESWLSKGQDDKQPTIPPSTDPNRIEVLLVSSLRLRGRTPQQSIVILEMVRDKQGKLTELREIERIEDDGDNKVESPLLLAAVRGFRLGSVSGRRRNQ